VDRSGAYAARWVAKNVVAGISGFDAGSSNSRSAQSLGAQIRNKTSPNKRANKGHKFTDKTP